MTKIEGITVEEFFSAIETMRSAYSFKNDKTKIVSTRGYYDNNPHLELYTIDENTGVELTLSKKVDST